MKYIKTFENNELKYKVGDFVKIKIIPDFVKDIERNNDNLFVEIIEITKIDYNPTIETHFTFKTIITKQLIYGNQYYIRRKMTKIEIKHCKFIQTTNKFNL